VNGGTITLPSWTTGHQGGALDFSQNSTTVVAVNNSSSLNNLATLTVSAWVYMTGGAGAGRIVDKSNKILFYISGNAICFGAGMWTTPGAWYGGSVTLNTWHHVAVTYDYTNISNLPVIYLDGTSRSVIQSLAPVAPKNSETALLCLGNANGGTRNFSGYLDDVRIYNRALTAAEVAQLYSQ
jgi:hypothetical protein